MSIIGWQGTKGLLLSCVLGCSDPSPAAPEGKAPAPSPGRVTTVVGTNIQGFDGDGRLPHESWLNQPTEMAFDPAGRLTVVDWNNHRIRRVDDRGRLETVIGVKHPGDWPPELPLDGAVAGSELALNHPMDLAFSETGALLVAAWHNHKLLELDAKTEDVSVVAGSNRPGYAEDGAAPSGAALNFPDSLVITADGALLLSDERNNVIRRVDPERATITTVVGLKASPSCTGDGGPGITAGLALSPYDESGGADNPGPGGGLALDPDGFLYVADTFNHCVRRIDPGTDGIVGAGDPSEELITAFAGSCEASGFVADATAETLLLHEPHDLEVRDGALFVADTGNHVVWRVALDTGEPTLVVGTGAAGDGPNGALPLETALDQPYGIAFDETGNLYVADTLNNRIRVLWK
jgi:sugar lactone lactonase YvrE